MKFYPIFAKFLSSDEFVRFHSNFEFQTLNSNSEFGRIRSYDQIRLKLTLFRPTFGQILCACAYYKVMRSSC